jgi:membrane-bound serine protease (ClpP class)
VSKNFLIVTLMICLLAIASNASPHVEWVKIDGAIGPVADRIVSEGLSRAETDSAVALVIEMDTPGGLLSTTRIICKKILASNVPVVMYIAPSGARAGSAGVFLTMAAHKAAMAHSTNIGAAHPVGIGGMGGGDTSKTMSDKVTNDAAAFVRTLAQRNHKNMEWAERAVRESVSATETEALDSGVVDFIAGTPDSLLLLLDGQVVILPSGSDTLHTAHASIRETQMSWRLKILDFLADPNIVYIFLLLGVYGLFFELYNPGAILPGVVGALSLILAFFSLQLLPWNWAGLLLIFLGIVLFLLEIKITSYGLLTVGGLISLILGSLLLFEPVKTGVHVGLGLVIPASLVTAAFFLFVVGMGLRAQRRTIVSGKEGLIGEIGTVAIALAPQGKIRVHGELWVAESSAPLEPGARVRVVAVNAMVLKVEPVQ